MSAAVASHNSSVVAARSRSPILLPSCASSGVLINPACVARPEDAAAAAAARDAKRRHRRDEEAIDVKRRRRDDARSASPDRRRKRDSVDDGRRGSSSRNSCRRMRPASSVGDAQARRGDAHRAAKNQDGERAQEVSRRRSRSWNPPSESRARPDPCSAAQQQMLAAIAVSPVAALDSRLLQECTEQFEEAEWRRRDTQRRREEARREMDKVVKTVYFNDPFMSPLDVLFKR